MFNVSVELNRHHFETGTPSDPYRHPFALALSESSLSEDSYTFHVRNGTAIAQGASGSYVANLSRRLVEMGGRFDSQGSAAFEYFSAEPLCLVFSNLWAPHVVNLTVSVTPADVLVTGNYLNNCVVCPASVAIHRTVGAYGWPQPYEVDIINHRVVMTSGPMRYEGDLPGPVRGFIRAYDDLCGRLALVGKSNAEEVISLVVRNRNRWPLTLVSHPQLFTSSRGI